MLDDRKFISNKISKIKTLIVLLGIFSMFGCAASTYYRPTASNNTKETSVRKSLTQLKQFSLWNQICKGGGWLKDFSWSANKEGLSFDIKGEGRVNCSFTSLDPEVITVPGGGYYLLLGPQCGDLWIHAIPSPGMKLIDALRDPHKDIELANILYVLKVKAKIYRRDDSAAEAAFANEAKRYREIQVKPALPEDVQRYRVMAEDAFKNKDFEKALEYYREGLAIDPLWPQGQFNVALLAGELEWYDFAALHMKHYLELVPDAANSKAAREKMYLWEGKGKE